MSGKTKKRVSKANKEQRKGQAQKVVSENGSSVFSVPKQSNLPLPGVGSLFQYEVYDQTLPQEKVDKVKPYWQQLSSQQRCELLQLSLDDLHVHAKELVYRSRQRLEQALQSNNPVLPFDLENYEEILNVGIQRLKDKGTWKLWTWMSDKKFTDMESFRSFVEQNHMPEPLRALMTRDDSKMETKAETALRKRMQSVLNHVHSQTKQFQDELSGNKKLCFISKGSAAVSTNNRVDVNQVILDKNVEFTKYMLSNISKEHELLNQSILMPIIDYITEVLPENKRRTTIRDLAYEDLEQLKPEEIGNICEWLMEKVDGLTAKWKLDPEVDEEEEEEEVMGDIDLFQLSDDNKYLTINAKWLDHLQDRTLSSDGNPRKSKSDEDPDHVGLLLEWIFGSIVSTAEKAREGAKRMLGNQIPDAMAAFRTLLTGLEEFKIWKNYANDRRELLQDLDTLKQQLHGVDISRVPASGGDVSQQTPLSQQHIYTVLSREHTIQRAKELQLKFGVSLIVKEQANLQVEIRQHESQLQKYRRVLDVLRLQQEMISYQSSNSTSNAQQLATEQLEVQAHLNATGAALTQLHHKKAKLDSQKQAKEGEMVDINQCKYALQQLMDKLLEVYQAKEERRDVDLEAINNHDLLIFNNADPQSAMQCIAEYFENFWHCALTTRVEEQGLRAKMQNELEICEEKADELKAVLGHLEMHFLNVSCDDPGTIIGAWLALPMLQDRLEQKAFDFATKLAEKAQTEMLRLMEEETMKEQQSRERKASKRAKMKERERVEKEKLEAQKKAEVVAKRHAEAEAVKQQEEQVALERKRREEEVSRLRQEEEAALELRRQQLLEGEDNHWKQRMQEQQMQQWLSSTLSAEDVEEAARELDSVSTDQSDEDGFASDKNIVVEKRYQRVNNRPKRMLKLPNKRSYDRNHNIYVKQHRNDPLKGHRNWQLQNSSDKNNTKRNRRNSHPPLRKSVTNNSSTTNASSMTQSSSNDDKDVVLIASVRSCPVDQSQVQLHYKQTKSAQVEESEGNQQLKQQLEKCSPEQKQYEQQPGQFSLDSLPSQQQQQHQKQQYSSSPEIAHVDEQRTVSTDSIVHPDVFPDFVQAGIGIEIKKLPIGVDVPTGFSYTSPTFPLPPQPPALTSHNSLPILTQPPMQAPISNFGQFMVPQGIMPIGFVPSLQQHQSTGALPLPPAPTNWLPPPPLLPPFQVPYGQPPNQFPLPVPAPTQVPTPHPGAFMPINSMQAQQPLSRLNPGAKEFIPVDSDSQGVVKSPLSENDSATGFVYSPIEDSVKYPTLMDQVESKCDMDAPTLLSTASQSTESLNCTGGPPTTTDTKSRQDHLECIQQRLNLVRGLSNESGQSNCFVNVIVQSLWHLQGFRKALLKMPRGEVDFQNNSADNKVLLALWELFQAFEKSPQTSIVVEAGSGQDNLPIIRSDSHDWSLSVKELRNALSELSEGNFVLNEMQDACEVLGELLACMHRSQSTDLKQDPFLPRKLEQSAGSSNCQIDIQNIVAQFFGLDVCVVVRENSSRWHYEQFLKFFHFVPAQGLREAAGRFFDQSFETVITLSEHLHSINSKSEVNRPDRAKLNFLPGVFTLAIVWESANVKQSDINRTISVIDTELKLAKLFDGLTDLQDKSTYYLQCMVCYYRHHYYSFAFLEELDKWLLFDDSNIQVVGEFREVQGMISAEGWQPILLFYEQENSIEEC
eukprot:TRINITY_DN8944_c1_g1_i2.p1 TRINITY_DN8944_c1_g1~~TRINITY_DN8944_c1_g1_i2.p1  ORF type:complete len:1698 (-),score=169.93 TRINITY_DN8944_c1_g1_i2:1184-6277(-)